jgi:glycosyltransferase involved in cell wall biosynthesis
VSERSPRWRSRPSGTSQYDVVFYAPRTGSLVRPSREPAAGGAETQIFLLSRELAQQGHSVALVVREDECRLPRRMGAVTVISQRTVRHGSPLVRAVGNAVTTIRALWRLDADVFVQRAAGRETGLIAAIAFARRRRFVYSSANVIDFEFARLEKRRVNVALYHLGIRLADQVVVQTREQAALCLSRFGFTPIVIKSLAEVTTRRTRGPRAFLWVGRLTTYKQPLRFVELARGVPEAAFWMVATGEGQMANELRGQIELASRGLKNFELRAARPRQELTDLMDRAVAIVNTSEYEGMPNIFLEGWSRGVPALALSHDPDRVISQERLGGFAGGDHQLFIDLARQLWERRYHQEDVAERCLSYVRREHAPDVIARQWSEALRLRQQAAKEKRVARTDEPADTHA